eukprot:8976280-Prorocentrum_lima.AAC.1
MAVSFLKDPVQARPSQAGNLNRACRLRNNPAAQARPPQVGSLNRACRLHDNSADPHCHTDQAYGSCPCRPTPSQNLMA